MTFVVDPHFPAAEQGAADATLSLKPEKGGLTTAFRVYYKS
jgi:hypothetical protein